MPSTHTASAGRIIACLNRSYGLDLSDILTDKTKQNRAGVDEIRTQVLDAIKARYPDHLESIDRVALQATSRASEAEDIIPMPSVLLTRTQFDALQSLTGADIPPAFDDVITAIEQTHDVLIDIDLTDEDPQWTDDLQSIADTGYMIAEALALFLVAGGYNAGGEVTVAVLAASVVVALASAAMSLIGWLGGIFTTEVHVMGMVLNATNYTLEIEDWSSSMKGPGVYLKHGKMEHLTAHEGLGEDVAGIDLGTTYNLARRTEIDGVEWYGLAIFQGASRESASVGVEGFVRFSDVSKTLNYAFYLQFASPQKNDNGAAPMVGGTSTPADGWSALNDLLYDQRALYKQHIFPTPQGTFTLRVNMDDKDTNAPHAIYTIEHEA
jgi:hypothetical protein